MVFTEDEIDTELLGHVKDESKSWLYKEIKEELEDFFNDWEKVDTIDFTPSDMKRKFFNDNHKVEINFLRRVLKNEFGMLPTKGTMRYTPFEGTSNQYTSKRIGRVYRFYRDRFVIPIGV